MNPEVVWKMWRCFANLEQYESHGMLIDTTMQNIYDSVVAIKKSWLLGLCDFHKPIWEIRHDQFNDS